MIVKDFKRKIEEFRNKSIQDKIDFLSNFWEFPIQGEPFKLIGTYKKSETPDKNGKEYGFFYNVRSINGDILYYPFNLGQVRIWVEHRENLINQEFWQFDVEISNKDDRNPFKLNLINRTFGNPKNKFLDRIEKEKLIRKIFDETGYTQRDAKNTSNALKKIAGDLYTETERFIFELLQNADDIPNERGEVDVRFILLLENLLFLHNGKSFDNLDVESISSIGDSTKRKDTEKTGYKGIGFKSVFTDADTVLINSGNYSFSFDKNSPLYYGENIEEIPWEIKPIWTELYRYPKEVRANKDFFNYPVAIDLEVGVKKIITYRQQIKQLFSEPRFILFLRHIKCIEVQGLKENIKIQKCKKDERFELLWNASPINEWIIDDFDFSVSQDVRDAMSNDKIVPPKLKEIRKSKLSFACQIKDNEIISVEPDKSYLFTYLPTNVNDYKFPFLVNADFLTTANRQSIHIKNSWNLFLFEQVGYLCFKWISEISKIDGLRNTVTNLIPTYFENDNEPIQSHFNMGFNNAIAEIAFLPTYTSELTKVSEAVVDLTGFTDIISDKLFIDTPYSHKNLILNELKRKETLTTLRGISVFGKDELKKVLEGSNFWVITTPEMILDIFARNKKLNIDSCDIRDIIENANIDNFNRWIENCNDQTYNALISELEKSNLRHKTRERICELKLFRFSDNFLYSFNDIVSVTYDSYKRPVALKYRNSNIIVHNKKTWIIKAELEKMGFVTSEKNLSEYASIFSCITMPSEKSLFDLIADKCKTNTLTAQERKKIFLNFLTADTKFDSIAEGTLKELCLFSDSQGFINPINELVDSNIQTPTWINSYKISENENFSELKQFLIPEKYLYSKIIIRKWDEIIASITDVNEFYSKVIYYYGLDDTNPPLRTQKFVYTKDGFLISEKVFFNSEMIKLENQYAYFQQAVELIYGLPTPEKSIATFLVKEPFRLYGLKFFGKKIYDTVLNEYQVKAVLTFCKHNNEQFFKNCIIKKEGPDFLIIEKTVDKYQITSTEESATKFISENCDDKLFILPMEFLEYRDEDGIVKEEDLHSLILNLVDVNQHKETLVDIVRYQAKFKYLQKLSNLQLSALAEYSKDSYEYKVLEMACHEITDYVTFRQKLTIEINTRRINLAEIQPFVNKISFHNVELQLSEIIPESYQNSKYLSNITERFVKLGLPQDKLNSLFGINNTPIPSHIFNVLLKQVYLNNWQQLCFVYLYCIKYNTSITSFKVKAVNGQFYSMGDPFYLQDFSFINDFRKLSDEYTEIKNHIAFPNQFLLNEPFFTGTEFKCPFIRSVLTTDQRKDFIDFIYDQWTNHDKKSVIKRIDWSKIEGYESTRLIGFIPNESVYPNEFSWRNEKIPEYLADWINEDNDKINFLADLGVWIDSSLIVELRKFWIDKSDSFNKRLLLQERKFNTDGIVLMRSLYWLIEQKKELNKEKHWESFETVVKILSPSFNLTIDPYFDYSTIFQISTEWGDNRYSNWKLNSRSRFRIMLHPGKLPKLVKLGRLSFSPYHVFMRFSEDDRMYNNYSIYINEEANIKDELHAIALDSETPFTLDHLWQLYSGDSEKVKELTEKIADLEYQLQQKPSAKLGAENDNSISKEDQKEANREAKQIVKEHLESKGFSFTHGINGYSTINGVIKDGAEFPLVVKSYKWSDEPFKIGANEWLQLMKPNSMFWVHFGNRKLGCLKLNELLRKQDKLTISFGTENLDIDGRIDKFAELLHYFSNVHFDFSSIKSEDYRTADDLNDYRFDERKTEMDLSSDSDSQL